MENINNLFNSVFTDATSNMSVSGMCIALLIATAMGLLIGFTYFKTQTEIYQRSMAITLFILPIIMSVIILFVGSNIARAFSLAGTLSIVRFRSAPGDPKDIGFIFFSIAAGLACGVGLYGYGALFVLILCILIFVAEKCRIFTNKDARKTLKITIPENLNYEDAFDDILSKYTKNHTLERIKTTDLGSLFELVYCVTIKDGQNEQEFLNELRCRNGNLTIILAVSPVKNK